jgi:hypothetical protein
LLFFLYNEKGAEMTGNSSFKILFVFITLLILFSDFNVFGKELDKEKVLGYKEVRQYSLEQLIEAISNKDIYWKPERDSRRAIIYSAATYEIYRRKDINSIPLLIKALNDDEKLLAAHVLLTKMLLSRYSFGPFRFNDFSLRAYQKNPKKEKEKIIKYWKSMPLDNIHPREELLWVGEKMANPKWFIEAVKKEKEKADDTKNKKQKIDKDSLSLTVEIIELGDNDKRYINYAKEDGDIKHDILAYGDTVFLAFDDKGEELGRFAECFKIYDEKRNALFCIYSRRYPWMRPVNIKISKSRIVAYDYEMDSKIICKCSFNVETLKLKVFDNSPDVPQKNSSRN